jgi:hypothetical protein
MFIANGTCSVYRGTRIDEYGDQVDTNTPIARKIPISLVERTRQYPSASADETYTVVRTTGKVRNADIHAGDRLKIRDSWYSVDAVIPSSSPIERNEIALELTKSN